ncbi:MAG TPA: hypothetical protein VGD98_11420 [Ktedonobacteraceae bacterium]
MRHWEPGGFFQTGVRAIGLFLLGWTLLVPFVPATAYADGGAPNLAYIAGAQQGVGVIDIAQQHIARSFAVAGSPNMLLLSPDGSILYITRPGVGSIVALATKTGQVICNADFPGHPALLALSVDSTALYVAGLDETTLLVLNAQTCTQERSFQVPEPVHWLAATLANVAGDNTPSTQLWLAGPNAVSILDDQGQLQDSIAVAGDPQFLSLPGTLTAYVATRQGSVIALDMVTHRTIGTLLSGGAFGSMDYDAVTGDIYVPDQRLRQVDVLTPVLAGMASLPREPSYTWPMPASPQAVAVTNDGQLGFVALASGQVAMLDIPGQKLINTIAVGGSPRFIIAGVYPPPNVPPSVVQAPFSPVVLFVGFLIVVLMLLGIASGIFWFIKHQKARGSSKGNAAK